MSAINNLSPLIPYLQKAINPKAPAGTESDISATGLRWGEADFWRGSSGLGSKLCRLNSGLV